MSDTTIVNLPPVQLSERDELLRDALRFISNIDNSAPIVRRLRTELQHSRAEEAVAAATYRAVEQAQGVLAEYIVPDSGISDNDCVNSLLGILDHQDLVRAMRASPAPSSTGVRVKKLEWTSYGGLRWRATTPMGKYIINVDANRQFVVFVNGEPLNGRHSYAAAAKLEGQSHFEAAILSSIAGQP